MLIEVVHTWKSNGRNIKNILKALGSFLIFKLGDLRLFLTGTCYSIQETQVTGAALTYTANHSMFILKNTCAA